MRKQNPFDSFYKSPFVQRAEQKAQVRAKEALVALKRVRSLYTEYPGEWNSDVKTTELFDPELKKAELFPTKSIKQSDVTKSQKFMTTTASPNRESRFNATATSSPSRPRQRRNESFSQSPTRSMSSNNASEKRRLGRNTLRASEFPTRRPPHVADGFATSSPSPPPSRISRPLVAPHVPRSAPPTVPTVASIQQFTRSAPAAIHRAFPSADTTTNISAPVRAIGGGTCRSTSPFDEHVLRILLGDSLEEDVWANCRPRRTVSSTISATVVSDRGRVSRGTDTASLAPPQMHSGPRDMNVNSEESFLVDEIERWYPAHALGSEYDTQDDQAARPLTEVVEQMRLMLMDRDAEEARLLARTSRSRPVSASSARRPESAGSLTTRGPAHPGVHVATQASSVNESSYTMPAEQVEWLHSEINQLRRDIEASKTPGAVNQTSQATRAPSTTSLVPSMKSTAKPKIRIQAPPSLVKEFELHKLNNLK